MNTAVSVMNKRFPETVGIKPTDRIWNIQTFGNRISLRQMQGHIIIRPYSGISGF